jgi:hypothetical protein
VFTSEYCRCVETAERLAFGSPLPSIALTAAPAADSRESARRGAAFRRMVGQVPPHTNWVAVTHVPNIAAAFGTTAADLGEGDALVVRAAASGEWQTVGRLPLRALSAFAHGQGWLRSGRPGPDHADSQVASDPMR